MSDIYTIDFEPSKLSHRQDELGLEFADLDTAVELMKKEEKGRLSDSQKLWAVQSKALGTPHFVVKGGLTECLYQIKKIIEKNIPVRC
jgi:hypothetical protein